MAKYSKKAEKTIESVMHRMKKGKLESGPGGKGGKVKNRKQAIAIAISEAREKGAKVPPPPKKKAKKSAKKTASKKTAHKSGAKKTAKKTSRKR
jgi:hypothetical protein